MQIVAVKYQALGLMSDVCQNIGHIKDISPEMHNAFDKLNDALVAVRESESEHIRITEEAARIMNDHSFLKGNNPDRASAVNPSISLDHCAEKSGHNSLLSRSASHGIVMLRA